jgi:DNA-directed RNA polymerase specialized sigma24 family protein
VANVEIAGDIMPEAGKDVFPKTLSTWIARQLETGDAGRAEVNRHVMAVYAFPLQIYFKGSSDRWLGEAEDVVHGFFADRLARRDFFADWQLSGLRLRRWLMNAFCFYLKELRRSRRKLAREEVLDETSRPGASPLEGDVAGELDRAFAVSVVRRALARTEEICRKKGLESHWGLFLKHYYEGRAYKDFAAARGLDEVRAATMVRTVAGKFRAALRETIARDGATESEINRELESLLDSIS